MVLKTMPFLFLCYNVATPLFVTVLGRKTLLPFFIADKRRGVS
jgi:hypothetical protein